MSKQLRTSMRLHLVAVGANDIPCTMQTQGLIKEYDMLGGRYKSVRLRTKPNWFLEAQSRLNETVGKVKQMMNIVIPIADQLELHSNA